MLVQHKQMFVMFLLMVSGWAAHGQEVAHDDKFRQLEEILPTPNSYRTASGAPGHAYWQQQADYDIKVEIDDARQMLTGSERISYTNNSPDTLRYLWVQLENNIKTPASDSELAASAPEMDEVSYWWLHHELAKETFDGGFKISRVVDDHGAAIDHTIVKTMMRLDLREPLKPKDTTRFHINWSCKINDAKVIGRRTGYEYFEKDQNYIYELGHWFPRMAAYTDVNGWQNKQFMGRGEFTLEFGNYKVAITVPADHIVAATGVLQNPEKVLTKNQRERLKKAESAERPLFVVTPEEALAAQGSKRTDKKTWVFHAENVRDFAFASSRKFIWDAMVQKVEGKPVWAMSYYPNEAAPLWSRYSTHAIAHTLDVYSRFATAYPYPVALSVNGPIHGMEYPMICFCGRRPEEDGTYSKRTKYGLISLVIHEVGHNWFPMMINSDERQWTWMDEGLNSFLQSVAQREWEEKYPARWGTPRNIGSYMSSDRQVPIMTNSESLLQFGGNAYAKPAAALTILRETVLGRELFDFAFKEYCRRWAFKRPEPADLFRTLEDASAVDLDWFWRGWFYTTDHVDIAIEKVRLFEMETGDPENDKALARARKAKEKESLSSIRDKKRVKRVERFPELLDFYNEYDPLAVTVKDRDDFAELLQGIEDRYKPLLKVKRYFYVLDFVNKGGLVMPVILDMVYEDGTQRQVRIPAELWRRNSKRVSKLFVTQKKIVSVTLDPHLETADTDLSNNHWPRLPVEGVVPLKGHEEKQTNPMQEARKQKE